jgi:very-short-patch-repair endonuclease
MRKSPTDAETKLWKTLRMKNLSGYRFRRQYPLRGYIVDFYCVACRLAVELDGGQHGDPAHLEYDQQRTLQLQSMGVRVLRFWDDDVLKNTPAVADEILRVLEEKQPPPQPSPGVPEEGE